MRQKSKLDVVRSPSEYQHLIEERIQVLRDTFGERDQRVRRVESRVAEMTEDPTPAKWHIAALYVAWATKNPGDILHEPTYDCSCGAGRGWVAELDERGRIAFLRPCSRCNAKVFEVLYQQGESRVSAGQRTGEPPLEAPPWDDL